MVEKVKKITFKKSQTIASTTAAMSFAMPLLLSLMLSSIGCSSQSDELVIPDAASVPPPGTELRGDAPDQSLFKRVKIK